MLKRQGWRVVPVKCCGSFNLLSLVDARRSITPFDPTELPSHLKACKNLKKKETLKDDVQVATEDARRSRYDTRRHKWHLPISRLAIYLRGDGRWLFILNGCHRIALDLGWSQRLSVEMPS